MNIIRTFFAKLEDPRVTSRMQMANIGFGLSIFILLFTLFFLIELSILTFQLVQVPPLENKIKEFNENTNSLSKTSFRVKKIELQKEVINFEFQKINLVNNVWGSRFQLFGFLFFAITAYLSWQTVTVSKEKQITEVLSKAIEQLGNTDSIEVRLGGIYTLERIARDSNKDFWTVMEILMAYIKKRTSSVEIILEPSSASSSLIEEPMFQDVQAALKVIARRIVSQDPANLVIDLSLCNFKKTYLKKARFDRVDLSGTSFEDSSLENSRFLLANLSGTSFLNADLSNSDFRRADLSNSNFQDAKLEGAKFKETKFDKTNLKGADLSNAVELTQAQIDSALTDSKTILPTYLLAKERETNS